MALHLSMPMATACGVTVWPKPCRPSTTASTGVSVTIFDRAVGVHHAVALPLQIARHARDAVAVVAGQVGGDQILADALAPRRPSIRPWRRFAHKVGERPRLDRHHPEQFLSRHVPSSRRRDLMHLKAGSCASHWGPARRACLPSRAGYHARNSSATPATVTATPSATRAVRPPGPSTMRPNARVASG